MCSDLIIAHESNFTNTNIKKRMYSLEFNLRSLLKALFLNIVARDAYKFLVLIT
jgi:hypothetical protein